MTVARYADMISPTGEKQVFLGGGNEGPCTMTTPVRGYGAARYPDITCGDTAGPAQPLPRILRRGSPLAAGNPDGPGGFPS